MLASDLFRLWRAHQLLESGVTHIANSIIVRVQFQKATTSDTVRHIRISVLYKIIDFHDCVCIPTAGQRYG